MRALLIATITLTATTATAQSIFPAGGHVPHSPTLWIATTQMPRVEVTDKRGPVTFELDELQVESGPRRIALRPQVGSGPFTVMLDGVPIRYEADPIIDRNHRVEIQRVAIERIRGREMFVIDATAEPSTMMYFLNHSSPGAISGDVLTRHVWVGPGRALSRQAWRAAGVPDPGESSIQRFELPLADLGVSCASTATVELAPYTTHTSGETTVHAIGKLQLANGEVALPSELVGDFTGVETWMPCGQAAVRAAPKAPPDPRSHARPARSRNRR